MATWALANQDVFRTIGNLFGMRRSGAHYCVFEVFEVICRYMKPEYIKWPIDEACSTIAAAFENKYGIPNVAGCIDGTHIPVKAPSADRDSYVNRKGFTSINVLAVCDNNMRFTYLYADRAGSVHDARVLRVCSLGDKLEDGSLLKGGKYHLLGDSAYPLLPALLVPYRDNGHLSEEQRRFNSVHSTARSIIERAFGRLKVKFRRLRGIDATRMTNALLTIEAAFTLHNFVLHHDGDDCAEIDVLDIDCSDELSSHSSRDIGNAAMKLQAQAKRDNIARLL
jgi:hypothetical protein